MQPQHKTRNIFLSVLSAIGMTILLLLIGLLLDYAITQILSQFFISGCSEDCYFNIFNAVFIAVAALSAAGGVRAGLRTYKRLSQ